MRYDNSKLKLIGYQYPGIVEDYAETIQEIIKESDKENLSAYDKMFDCAFDGFILGYMAGKRAERNRKKVLSSNQEGKTVQTL